MIDAYEWVRKLRISAPQKLVLFSILCEEQPEGVCNLSVSKIASYCALSPRSVQLITRDLARQGLLVVHQSRGGTDTNGYQVLVGNRSSDQPAENMGIIEPRNAVYVRSEPPARRRLDVGRYRWTVLRRMVFERDGFRCTYCGTEKGKLECDHIVPLAQGGRSVLDNLTTSCKPCNMSKGAKTPEQWVAGGAGVRS